MVLFYFSECASHCSLCYNSTECYECTQGYYLNELAECERKQYFFDTIKLHSFQFWNIIHV